jgi:meso-butanediol dehydrogenase/(S,S)-butanediol dehydrogenase/diacetyl reductase
VSRVVVLTGAASGIGYATAERFLAEGDTVIGLDVADTVPDGVRHLPVDVADKTSVTAAFDTVANEQGSASSAAWRPSTRRSGTGSSRST